MNGETKTLEQLVAELREAKERIEQTTEEKRKAEARYVDAVNVYNGLSRRIDAALSKIREASPAGTAWKDNYPAVMTITRGTPGAETLPKGGQT